MRRRWLTPLLVILLPVMLVAGIWLGGHPENLPDKVRDTLVADTDGRVYEEAIDTLERDYYRKVDRKKLLDQSLEQAVGSLDDRFSHYFAPRDFTDFQAATEGRFEGVGHDRRGDRARPARAHRLQGLPGRPRRAEAR